MKTSRLALAALLTVAVIGTVAFLTFERGDGTAAEPLNDASQTSGSDLAVASAQAEDASTASTTETIYVYPDGSRVSEAELATIAARPRGQRSSDDDDHQGTDDDSEEEEGDRWESEDEDDEEFASAEEEEEEDDDDD